jgi:hypothetical protein
MAQSIGDRMSIEDSRLARYEGAAEKIEEGDEDDEDYDEDQANLEKWERDRDGGGSMFPHLDD